MRKLLVASEYTEPSHHYQTVIDRLRREYAINQGNIALLLITKIPRDCYLILKAAKDFEIPTITHITITGSGGTRLEPHIPKYTDTLKHTGDLFTAGSLFTASVLKPETTVLRIDPIMPLLYNGPAYLTLFDEFSKWGVRNCRISIVDYYPHVINRLNKTMLPHPNKFQENKSEIDLTIHKISELAKSFGFQVHLCAERYGITSSNVDTLGCASKEEWGTLGITDLQPIRRKQRNTCTCNVQKYDLLVGLPKGCPDGCIYCYWRRKGE